MVEVMKASGKPTAVTMAISDLGDRHGITPGECALRLVRAGTLDEIRATRSKMRLAKRVSSVEPFPIEGWILGFKRQIKFATSNSCSFPCK